MRLLVCGESERGKTTLIKEIIKSIQKKHTSGDITFIITDYPDEFTELEYDNHKLLLFKKD